MLFSISLKFNIQIGIDQFYQPRYSSFTRMDYNKLSFYRANPFANNDFIPEASMANRKKKQFVSQIPQGQEYYPSKFGKRIFKEKVYSDEIQKDNILNSPQRYPFQNRIALDKNFRRNLDTIDIEGASSGTKVSQSIRNKHKALQQLKRRNQQQIKSPLIGQSLDQVYQKQRRQLAQQIHKNIQMRKTKQNFINTQNDKISKNNKETNKEYNVTNPENIKNQINPKQLQNQYERYVSHNSNQKYNSFVPNSNQYNGFQRYKRVQNAHQTLDSYNNGRIPQNPPSRYNIPRYNSSIDNYASLQTQNQRTNPRGIQTLNRSSSIDVSNSANPRHKLEFEGGNNGYSNNSVININNRHRSNPVYVQNYPIQMHNRIQQMQKNKQIQSSLKSMYSNDKAEFRRNNPTHLSFNIAAKSSLMGPII